MPTLAVLDGLLSPLHITLLLGILVVPTIAIVAFVVWFVRRKDGRR